MCCLISVFNWFVIILTFVVLLVTVNERVLDKSWSDLAEDCFTDVVLHGYKSYHQELAFATTSATLGCRGRVWRCNVMFPRSFECV